MDISIIIVSWNAAEMLPRCLDSIFSSHSKVKYEVILVDNASQDETVATVRNFYPDVHIVENKTNLGFARAVNIGYRRSSGKYIMSLNPDTEVLDGTLDEIVMFLDKNPQIGLLAPGIIEPRLGQGISVLLHESPFRMPPLSFLPARVLFSLLRRSQAQNKSFISGSKGFIEGNYIEGPCIVARREVLENDRFFSEDTFMYNEEFPLCEDVRKKGYKVGVLTSSVVKHVGSASYLGAFDHTFAVRLEATRGWYHFHHERGYPVKWIAILQLLDALPTFIGVWIKNQLSKEVAPDRIAALAYHRSRIVGFFWILISPKRLEVIARNNIRRKLGGEW